MCPECGGIFTHDWRCPYYDSRKNAVYICRRCAEGIGAGDTALIIDGRALCSECVGDMDAKDLLAFTGYEMRQVEAEEKMDI